MSLIDEVDFGQAILLQPNPSNGNITIHDADDFCEMLLSDAHVGSVSGVAFGDPNCFRISYAASEENIRKAISNIKRVLEDFK